MQLPDFKAKMHQIRFRQTPLEELTALPHPLAGLRGPTSKGREGKGKGERGKEREGGRRRGKGRKEGQRGGVWICL